MYDLGQVSVKTLFLIQTGAEFSCGAPIHPHLRFASRPDVLHSPQFHPAWPER
jgi:hypothetical protein